MIEDIEKNVFDGLLISASSSAYVSFSGCGVEFDGSDSGSVLTPISLFLQEQLEFVETVE